MKMLGGTKVCLSFSLVLVFVFAFNAVSSADTQAELKKLYEAAKADGRVVWSWPTAAQVIEPVINKFQAKFPDVKVSPGEHCRHLPGKPHRYRGERQESHD